MNFKKFVIFLMGFLAMAGQASATYWFQSGVSSPTTSNNQGGSVYIQTIYQLPKNASLGFWVGENLANSAFVQVGYQIENATGYYPNNCSINGCSSRVYLTAGTPTWFWEYIPPSGANNFYGALGPDGSAGLNGSFNMYSMESNGSTWYFYFNGKKIGSVDAGSGSSGPYPLAAIGEIAGAINNFTYMSPVKFRNMRVYINGSWSNLSEGYSFIGYGAGSETLMKNNIGVEEVQNYSNYFEVGSGLPVLSNNLLWKNSFTLFINSSYGNKSSASYIANSKIEIKEPREVMLNNSAKAVFEGWIGKGAGSYTGSSNYSYVIMYSNITETPKWAIEYYVNATSAYGKVNG
ncbi:MAG: hypothetical protein ACP5RP_02740, partial [Candidatus Micrarchaeia archaeon]